MKRKYLAAPMAMGMLIAASPAQSVELDISPSGFVDFVWTLSDGTDQGKNGAEGQFDTMGELDIESKLKDGVSLRFDADLNSSTSGSDSARLEQIYLQWDIDTKTTSAKGMSLKGGVFNNKLGFEREDKPEMYQITHGQLWDIWNVSTAEDGNNLQGLEFNVQLDKVNLIIGYLNDLNETPEENSVELAAELGLADDFNMTLGLVTQDQNLETIFDISASYETDKLLLAGELLVADEQIDNGLMLMANVPLSEKFAITARYDLVSYDGPADDTTSLTFAGLYGISDNLFVNAEVRLNDDDNVGPVPGPVVPFVGEGDGTTARLELLANF